MDAFIDEGDPCPYTLLGRGGALATVLASLALPASASAAPAASARLVHKTGTGSYKVTGTGSGQPASIDTEIRQGAGPGRRLPRRHRRGPAGAHRSLAPARRAPGTPEPRLSAAGTVHTNPQLLRSFDGLNHRDQRTANNGNQFTIEPPDQGAVRRQRPRRRGRQRRVPGVQRRRHRPDRRRRPQHVLRLPAGDRPDDRRLRARAHRPDLPVRPDHPALLPGRAHPRATPDGDLTGDNHLDIAVAADPTGTWNIYRLDVTDDGTNGTPVHPNCPCIGDYPHIGVDANGFYLTTNEYSFFGTEYNSAQIYAFSKRALARGDADVLVTQLDTTGGRPRAERLHGLAGPVADDQRTTSGARTARSTSCPPTRPRRPPAPRTTSRPAS